MENNTTYKPGTMVVNLIKHFLGDNYWKEFFKYYDKDWLDSLDITDDDDLRELYARFAIIITGKYKTTVNLDHLPYDDYSFLNYMINYYLGDDHPKIELDYQYQIAIYEIIIRYPTKYSKRKAFINKIKNFFKINKEK